MDVDLMEKSTTTRQRTIDSPAKMLPSVVLQSTVARVTEPQMFTSTRFAKSDTKSPTPKSDTKSLINLPVFLKFVVLKLTPLSIVAFQNKGFSMPVDDELEYGFGVDTQLQICSNSMSDDLGRAPDEIGTVCHA